MEDEIRWIIYITNVIESLNSVICKAINNRKVFPNDHSARSTRRTKMDHAAEELEVGLEPIRD